MTVKLAAVLTTLWLLLAGGASAAHAAKQPRKRPIADVPIQFTVQNLNRSTVQTCPVDEQTYTVRGHLIGQRRALKSADAVTLYNHGHSFGEFLWRYRGVPGYDHVKKMAKRGHVSVTYDRLGYESSDKPQGDTSCYASEADVTDQIIDQLRAGSYTVARRESAAFERVALVGHSQAAIINEGVAHTFKSPDALVHISFSGANGSPGLLTKFGRNIVDCTAADTTADSDPANPDGYAFRGVGEEEFSETNFFNADERVLADVLPRQNPDPCGFPQTVFEWTANNRIADPSIEIPVLVMFGDHDPNFAPGAPQLAFEDFRGSSDRTLEIIPESGHTMMLERTAPQFRAILSGWLRERGY